MKLTAIFARNLRLCRQQCGLSQERLAMFAGLDRSYIGKLERELSSPTLDAVEALSSALQIEPEVLIRRQSPEPKKRK
ncbi:MULTISPECIES: helix-turn-helix domain-containing protein [Agrobacterium]|uniref:Helix-turn-helix transcriptional regulator n=2 Tax=Agrobacterium TaxID=357 RepID=A0A4D7Z3B3_AGRTU|nr:helix-turn-helix transcriptional regulator [Agrobacterium tumefaciens]KJF71755.1 XRE family transcriptional regulator [Agrobacterium arsenijevicii]QCL96710.1 helix-turn-helix transcriptional regulator [Agrobacterium tumefaciens]